MVSKKVYIAADGFLSFIDRAHPKHVHVSALFRYFAQEHFQIYTTFLTINEVYEELYKNTSPALAKDFLRAIYMSSVNMIYPEASDIKSAIKTVATSSSIDLTFSKSLMATVCNKQSIPQICTFEILHPLFGLQVFYLPV